MRRREIGGAPVPQLNVRDLGDFIRDQRRTAQISLRQLAAQAGVSNPYLSQIERGLRKPSAEILQQIAKALRISAEVLYIQAGILDERVSDSEVSAAVLAEATLTERQKQVLLEIYEAFRRENAVRETTRPSAKAAAEESEEADDTAFDSDGGPAGTTGRSGGAGGTTAADRTANGRAATGKTATGKTAAGATTGTAGRPRATRSSPARTANQDGPSAGTRRSRAAAGGSGSTRTGSSRRSAGTARTSRTTSRSADSSTAGAEAAEGSASVDSGPGPETTPTPDPADTP
jgi:transcriptional regulator with XRE-family HTH domain